MTHVSHQKTLLKCRQIYSIFLLDFHGFIMSGENLGLPSRSIQFRPDMVVSGVDFLPKFMILHKFMKNFYSGQVIVYI